MKQKTKRNTIILAGICLIISVASSCKDEKNLVDEKWKAFNEKIVREVKANPDFQGDNHQTKSNSGNGFIYYKACDDFEPVDGTKPSKKPSMNKLAIRQTDHSPNFNDSISIRYTGWYLDYNKKTKTFDSTEGYKNSIPDSIRVNNLVDGMSTILQLMKPGDQYEVCIPYILGYKDQDQPDGSGNILIPAFTTLWFKVKLIEIIPEKKPDDTKKEKNNK